MTRSGMVKLALTLFAITAVTALLLGAVNAVTADRIAEINAEKTAAAMSSVMPSASDFEESISADDYTIYTASDAGGSLVGYVVSVVPVGFGGEIDMVVGFGLDANITGVYIISMSETAGVGDMAMSEPWFLEQFTGKSGELALGGGIDSISGATVTSKAVLKGISTACAAIKQEGLA